MSIRPFTSKKCHKNIYEYWNSKTKRKITCAGFTIDLVNSATGERVRKRICDEYLVVKELEKRLTDEIDQGVNIPKKIKRGVDNNLSEIFKKYKKHYDDIPPDFEESISELTIRRMKVAVDGFINSVGDMPPTKIDTKIVDKYKKARREKVKATTLNTDINHLKVICNWAISQDLIDANPFIDVRKLKTNKCKNRALDIDEWKKLLAVCKDSPEDLALILTYVFTGARRSEILEPKFTWKDIDFQNQKIHLRLRKRGKESEIFVPENLIGVLSELKRYSNSDYPFPYKDWEIYKRIIQLYKDAEIQIEKEGYGNLNVHSLRKSAGSFLTFAGTSVFDVKEFMAHSSISTTEKHYLSSSDERSKDIADTLNTLLLHDFRKNGDRKVDENDSASTTGSAKTVTENGDKGVLNSSNQYQNGDMNAIDIDMLINALIDYKNKYLELENSGSGAGIRTPDTRIMIPLL